MSSKSSTFAAANGLGFHEGTFLNKPESGLENKGKLSEWSKEPHSKCGVRITSYRGFESLTFRKEKGRFVCLSLLKQANRSFFL